MRPVARSEMLERYRALPLPTTSDEPWRFTDLAGFDPDAFSSNGASGVAKLETMLDVDVAGLASVSEAGIEIERAPEGVTFAPLAEDHERLGSLVGTDEKFAAHNAALWKHGLLVHVPKGVVLEQPLYVRIANAVEGGSLFWRLLVVAEPGSHVSLQNYSRETWNFATHHARVERDAELDWVAGGFGSKKGKIRIQNDLAGPGATSRVTGAYFADAAQHLDYDTYQENRNLLLSKDAHADSIPGLEILANDVRCTHGATLGQVDREQLFYLMARGLPRAEAERLIVRGFFQDVLDRIELEPVREAVTSALEARIPQA